jgi:hypothetical protein
MTVVGCSNAKCALGLIQTKLRGVVCRAMTLHQTLYHTKSGIRHKTDQHQCYVKKSLRMIGK